MTKNRKYVKRSVGRSAKRSVRRSAKRSVRRSAKRSVRRSAKRSVRRSAKRSVRRSSKQSVRRSSRKKRSQKRMKGGGRSTSHRFSDEGLLSSQSQGQGWAAAVEEQERRRSRPRSPSPAPTSVYTTKQMGLEKPENPMISMGRILNPREIPNHIDFLVTRSMELFHESVRPYVMEQLRGLGELDTNDWRTYLMIASTLASIYNRYVSGDLMDPSSISVQ